MVSKEDFVYALEKLAKEGNIEKISDFYKQDLNEEDKKLVEDAFVRGIELCLRNRRGNPARLVNREDLSDRILLAAMEACRSQNWLSEPLAKMLRERDESDAVMIKAMEICEEHSRLSVLFEMVNKKRLSDPVMIRLAELIAERGWVSYIHSMLQRPDVSDSVRETAEKILERTERKEQDPLDIIKEYLGKKRIGGDGILSETPRHMRKGPANGEKGKGKKIKTSD